MDNKCHNCGAINSNLSKYCSQCGYELSKLKSSIKQESNNDKSNSRKKIIQVIVGICAFIISFFISQKIFNNEIDYDESLVKVSSEINKNCPITVDKDTRLDNTITLPGKVFQYNYTLLNIEKQQINIDELEKFIRPNVVNNIRTSPDMKSFRDNDVNLSYNYKDKNGEFVLKINVKPSQYK